jgi:hypothetical protein
VLSILLAAVTAAGSCFVWLALDSPLALDCSVTAFPPSPHPPKKNVPSVLTLGQTRIFFFNGKTALGGVKAEPSHSVLSNAFALGLRYPETFFPVSLLPPAEEQRYLQNSCSVQFSFFKPTRLMVYANTFGLGSRIFLFKLREVSETQGLHALCLSPRKEILNLIGFT